MRSHITPKQVAQALGVSESSVKRWCDQGLIATERTAGGHRRLTVNSIIQFLRGREIRLMRPEILNLPPSVPGRPATLKATRHEMAQALEAGDEERFRRAGFNLYLAGYSVVEICDQVLAPVFELLGEKWQHQELEVYQERRGVEICLKFLHELRLSQPPPAAQAPLAIGGTFEGDWYVLPTTMVELSLREAGWRSQSYGASHPVETLEAALRARRPRLFWLSVSWMASEDRFVERFERISETAAECGTAVAVGGRALDESVRRRITYSAYCDHMGHLAAFSQALAQASSPVGSALSPGKGRES